NEFLIVDETDCVAAADGCLAVAKYVPGKSDIRSKVLPRALIPGTSRGLAGEVQRGVGEQGLHYRALHHRRQFQRVAFVGHAGQLIAQSQSQRKARHQPPLVLYVKAVVVEDEMAKIGRAGNEAGGTAGNVESLAIGREIT